LVLYTGGKKLDDKDNRAKGLLNLIKMIRILPSPPSYILMENVKNFEESKSRDLLIAALAERGYEWDEWLLTPTQFGIPNERKRYYLTARLKELKPPAVNVSENEDEKEEEEEEEKQEGQDQSEDVDQLTNSLEQTAITSTDPVPPTLRLRRRWPFEVDPPIPPPLSEFIDAHFEGGTTPFVPSSSQSVAKTTQGESKDKYKIPEAFVRKRKFISTGYVVSPEDRRSACFTKAYGKHGIGAGAYLMTRGFDVG
jgi:tRNA (cytosine38-C5)-methyltransferase